MPMELIPNTKVRHPKLGMGIVLAVMPGSTGVIVRFENTIENCLAESLTCLLDPWEAIKQGQMSPALAAISHFQALAIKSANDKWGVFSRSKIDLLPHQLWVCRQAKSRIPCRLLVADDVGLGKTIEAGIILSAFSSEGRSRRVLILTPASLADQWVDRMSDMFDFRTVLYATAADTEKTHFWTSNHQVVASYNTLSLDHKGRRNRLLQAPAWDLVIVDEAHHFNADERLGVTLGYQLVAHLQEHDKINNMIFFTGTPHRGKNFSFLALMRLLSPVFDPKKTLEGQLDELPNYMIRNNKYQVTDLRGNVLFKKPDVTSDTYDYSPEEQEFYDKLTTFISNGFLYADSQSHAIGSAVTLVLICMQKLASSSVTAIRNAIEKRLGLKNEEATNKALVERIHQDTMEEMDDDERAKAEENLPAESRELKLIQDERPALLELLHLADIIKEETKISTILRCLEDKFPDEQVLFFTEYKATQRLLLEALMRKYGAGAVTFINGVDRLLGVSFPDGRKLTLDMQRKEAARRFNLGEVRFLIATEAAGEGIDLQERCHVLIHVDLPWNPMRLHQRVGRLNRYGQTKKVIVLSFRNPSTVESRIWDKLNAKIANINTAFSAVMEESEDMFMLVLGMTPNSMFNELFSKAPLQRDRDSLHAWFDKTTAKFGQEDVLLAVKKLCQNTARFDYQSTSHILPHVDLPDLLKFWQNILACNHIRLFSENGVLRFNTPEKWKEEFGIADKYDNLVLHRKPTSKQDILGVGHKLFTKALAQGTSLNCPAATVPELQQPVLIYSVREQHTDKDGEKLVCVYGCTMDGRGDVGSVLTDWQLLKLLNDCSIGRLSPDTSSASFTGDIEPIAKSQSAVQQAIQKTMMSEIYHPEIPSFCLEGVLLPQMVKDSTVLPEKSRHRN